MAVVVLRDVHKGFSGVPVLTGVSAAVGQRDRIGFVGRNGEGKTTLLRMMAGLQQPDQGVVDRSGGAGIGLLDQNQPLAYDGTLEEAMLEGFAELLAMESQLREIEECMADPADPRARGRDLEALTRAYGHLTERFEAAGGYEFRTKVAQALTGLGFRTTDFARRVDEFSGGERVRGALARLLLIGPALLLLDEPTNHLDLEAVEWLEGYLQTYPGAVVLVSHDRFFLDRLAGRIWEIEGGILRTYAGNYTDYVRQKEEELLRDAVAGKQLGERIEQLRYFVAKFSAGTRAVQAKSKARMLARYERQAAALRSRTAARPRFRFEVSQTSGRDVLAVRDLAIEGGGRSLFAGLGFTVRAGDRLAILGPNGSGKTTLLRVLLGELDATAGTVEWGHGTEAAFLRQDLSDIDDEASVLDNVLAQSDMLPGDARSLLASFEFKGEDVFKPAAALSGGERCRLSMANLLISGANVLLLDEPTNHLDIAARGSLEDALAAYAGTVIFVSHDRYFIDRVANSVLAFERTGPAYHRGNFSSYRQARAAGLAPSTTETALPPAIRQQIEALLAERTALEAEMQQASGRSSPRESRRRVQRYREIENEIGRLQKRTGRGR